MKTVIEELQEIRILPITFTEVQQNALDSAIKSLEAQEKVKAEIKDIKDLYDLGKKEDVYTKMFIEGVETVEHIIDTYLKGVKE